MPPLFMEKIMATEKQRKMIDLELEMFAHRLHLQAGVSYEDLFAAMTSDQCHEMRQAHAKFGK